MFIQETDPVCDDTPSLSKEAENVYPVVNPAGRVQNKEKTVISEKDKDFALAGC